MPQDVKVTRTLLPTPTIDDPERKVYQIEYSVGELPPHFVYIPEKEWTKEKEAKLIKADMEKRMKAVGETITLP
jgi:3',5'-cyclic AMP phosphodiesterase CpdA